MLSEKEKLKATSVSKHEYPQDMMCMACGAAWMTHCGILCPDLDIMAILKVWVAGETTFIPDETYDSYAYRNNEASELPKGKIRIN